MKAFLIRLAKDDSGMETMEVALGLALMALIAGFGYFALGDSLANFFADTGNAVPGPQFPDRATDYELGSS